MPTKRVAYVFIPADVYGSMHCNSTQCYTPRRHEPLEERSITVPPSQEVESLLDVMKARLPALCTC